EHGRDVVAGIKANLCVFDPQLTWSVDPERLASKSINTPYVGRTLRGRVRHTIFKGTAAVIDGQAQK
ncbi:MAG: dihydroorotase, partial [Acidimicrobiaceae bacterium]